MKKKIYSLVIVIIIFGVCCLFSACNLFDDEESEEIVASETGTFSYAKNVDGKSYTLVSYVGKDRRVDIPKTYKGYAVTIIGSECFKDNKTICFVYIDTNIVTIENNAFDGCENLTNVVFKDTKTSWTLVSSVSGQNQSVILSRYLPNGANQNAKYLLDDYKSAVWNKNV